MKSTAKTYCYEKVAQPDSALYYSLRNLSSEKRNQVVAIHAFYREMEDVLLEGQDHELAMIKFNWWRNEVANLTAGTPDHPVMLLLQQSSLDQEIMQNKLLNIIDGFEQSSISANFATFEDVVVHWMRTAGERELLLKELLLNDEIISQEMMYQLMLIMEMVNYIQHLRLYTRHDLLYFSMDELQQFNVTQAMLHEYVTTQQIKNLLQYQVEKVSRAYSEMKKLSGKQRDALSHWIIRCEIAKTILQEIQKSDFHVLENLIILTPLRYWWIAFRA